MKQDSGLQSYHRQIETLSQEIKKLEGKSEQLANWRLFSILGGGLGLFVLFFLPYPLLFWIALGLISLLFGALVMAHQRVENSLVKFQIWRGIKKDSRARMLHDWKQIPEIANTKNLSPLELDFDLRQLHRLLNTASSHVGTKRLQEWLMQPLPDLQIIEQRQKLVIELKERPAFRDKLRLAARLSSTSIRGQIHLGTLHDWLDSAEPVQSLNLWLGILVVLQIGTLITFGLAQLGIIPTLVSGVLWAAYVLASLSRIRLLLRLSSDSQQLYDLLLPIRSVMQHLERYPYSGTPNLRKLLAPLLEAKPSEHLQRLMITLAASNLRPNPPIWLLLNALMPWDMFFARRLEVQKQELAMYLPQWLDIWYEIEALNSLANFAYLNRDSVLPKLSKSAALSVKQLAHPLIPSEKRVANDFAMQSIGELVILTGSNMSGKSSFLRTLGVNLLMAYAGGFVLADEFEAGLFRVFSCIRVTDSLEDGISYFYAEVKRLRALLDALQAEHELPLFFVIDEIFRGTNNRERLIGSRAYINALAGANGIGIIATHDLELTQIANENTRIRNMHFRESIKDGRMLFDYGLREGVSPSTNALEIMAIAGLPINLEEIGRHS
jgi:hypothetical protein